MRPLRKQFRERVKNTVKVLNCQLNIDKVTFLTKGKVDFNRNKQITNAQIDHLITVSQKHKPDIIVFPELSIPETLHHKLVNHSQTQRNIIIAGSYYAEDKDGMSVNTCPVIIDGIIHRTEKTILSPYEVPGNYKIKIRPGTDVRVFLGTRIGNFAVIVCMDFFNPKNTIDLVDRHSLDFIVVIALQKDSRDYDDFMSMLCRQSNRGLYVIYSNCISTNDKRGSILSDGRSSIHGLFDDIWKADQLVANLSDFVPRTKIIQLNEPDNYMLFSMDLRNKKPTRPLGPNAQPNVYCFEIGTCNVPIVKSKKNINEKVIRRIKEAIIDSNKYIDLAGLSEDEETATRHFGLNDLYIPLRLSRLKMFEASRHDASSVKPDRFVSKVTSEERARLFSAYMQPEAGAVGLRVGEFLKTGKRLVVLGAPGSGKSILLQWLSLAYALRKGTWDGIQLIDSDSLPDIDLLPIHIRCRDYKNGSLDVLLNGEIDEILRKSLQFEGISGADFSIFKSYLNNLLNQGRVIIMVDGLDEIESAENRQQFCRRIQQLSEIYEKCWFIFTSRIKGYRELSGSIGNGFLHVSVDELSVEDKIAFARKWCTTTYPAKKAKELTDEYIKSVALDSVAPLTGNPLLLTNICLLKRTRVLLPHRRDEVYYESVKLLFNRRPHVQRRVDYKTGIAHAMYIGYYMCEKGINQIRRGEVMLIIADYRLKYNTSHSNALSSDEFLALLESQTGLFVETGRERTSKGFELVYEFKHRTFQEYFVGLALVYGKYPGLSMPLADKLEILCTDLDDATAEVGGIVIRYKTIREVWREPILFALMTAGYDEVNGSAEMLLKPRIPVDSERALCVLSAECLAQDPVELNQEMAMRIINRLVDISSEMDCITSIPMTTYDNTIRELSKSKWLEPLKREVMQRMMEGHSQPRIMRLYMSLIHEDMVEHGLSVKAQRTDTVEGRIDVALRCVNYYYSIYTHGPLKRLPAKQEDSLFSFLQGWLRDSVNERPMVLFALAWATNSIHNGTQQWEVNSTLNDNIWAIWNGVAAEAEVKYILAILTKGDIEKDKDDAALYDWARIADDGPIAKSIKRKKSKTIIPMRIMDKVGAIYKELTNDTRRFIASRFAMCGWYPEMMSCDWIYILSSGEHAAVERNAVRLALGFACNQNCLPQLVDCLRSEDEEVRANSVLALIGRQEKKSIPPLLKLLTDEEASTEARVEAARALGVMPYMISRLSELERALESTKNGSVRKRIRISIRWLRRLRDSQK